MTDPRAEAAPSAVAGAEPSASPAEPSLRSKAVRGSIWTFGAYGAQKVVQLGSSVVLRRFLLPDVFGLMYIGYGVLRGLAMFSDFGIQPAVVQNKRGDERTFLDTAWTLQVARGVLLCLVAVAAAWPLASFYGEGARLVWLMLAMSAIPLLEGFTSTSLMTLQRHLEIKKLRLFELGVTCGGVAVTIALAWWTRSIWALVIGAGVGSALKVGFSFTLTAGRSNRFAWDRTSLHELIHFGKWIFLATAVAFISTNADGFILPKFVDMTALGVYATALKVVEGVTDLINMQTHSVLFPAFCRVARESSQRLRSVYYRVRLRVDALFLTGIGGLFVTSQWVIDLLFTPEYALAGLMLQFLCIRTAMQVVLAPCESCLFSLGKTRFGLYRSTARAVWVLCALPVGYMMWGLDGFLWAVALSEVPVLLVLWPAFRRFGLLDLRRELLAPLFFGAGMLLGHGWLRIVP